MILLEIHFENEAQANRFIVGRKVVLLFQVGSGSRDNGTEELRQRKRVKKKQ